MTAPNAHSIVARAGNHGPAAPAATSPGAPRTTSDVRDMVRAAIDRHTPLRIVGRGTWLAGGRPVTSAESIHLDALAGIVDYTPGDLTLTARAGTPLSEIAAATAAEGQWLALVPWGGDDGTLGATLATATAGPVAGAFGTPRDVAIGIETVTGTGDIVRGGGRVVKNVAGFDLTRLMVGAWGTLGVITEVSVRLRALPECDETVALPLNGESSLGTLLAKVRTAPIAPLSLELLSAAAARRLALGEGSTLLVRIAGNAELVAAQRAALAAVGDVVDAPPNVWTALRTVEPAEAAVVRLSGTVARFAETWSAAERLAAAAGGLAHASVQRSIVRVVMPLQDGALSEAGVAALRGESRDTRVFERLPASMWTSVAPTAVADRLSRGVRTAFDPHRLLNPGILGEPA
jgi:glycolate oxidase FAD binding subunit